MGAALQLLQSTALTAQLALPCLGCACSQEEAESNVKRPVVQVRLDPCQLCTSLVLGKQLVTVNCQACTGHTMVSCRLVIKAKAEGFSGTVSFAAALLAGCHRRC